MEFYSDNENKIVHGVGRFKNGVLKVNDPEDIDYMKNNYKYDEEESKEYSSPKKDIEDILQEYHTGRGWFKLPGKDNAVRKEEAIKILKEKENEEND